MDESTVAGSVLHILVVGFHHKRGCQVDFSFPPLFEDKGCESRDLPAKWKHLPCLALPDGAHNYDKDTIYFLLPGMDEAKDTVYGISCYKQMKAMDLIRKSSEVTRGTVQKSVVVLSKLPLFGLINFKLQLVTHAYFAERDFSKTRILKDFYNSLNASLPTSMPDSEESQVFVGLSAVELVKKFKHKILVLFKLMLLERRVLFFGAPVHSLCVCLLSVVSLFPEMIQSGMKDAACPRFYKIKTPTFTPEEFGIRTDDYFNVEMSHVPNYQKKSGAEGSRSSPLPSKSQSEKWERQKLRRGLEANASDRKQTGKLSRSISHDSGIKQTSRSSHVEKSRLDARPKNLGSVSESGDEEDELLNMIDEELFGPYFEEKRKTISRTFSESDATRQLDRDEQSTDTEDDEGGDGASDSANETSSLLQDEPNPAIEKRANSGKFKLSFMEHKEDVRTTNYTDTLGEGEIDKHEDGIDMEENKEQGDIRGDRGIRGDGGYSYQNEECKRILSNSRPDYQHLEDKNESHSRTTSESGISSMSGQKLEDVSDPSPQSIDRQEERGLQLNSLEDFVVLPDIPTSPTSNVDDFGFPLSLFGKGALCHPYMALQQHDLLQDVSVRCFVVGASNVLFKHKRQILDVIVEIESGEVTILDQELRKQLNLTTADLRFSDYVVNTVLNQHNDESDINNTGWEGGEEWIRAQFKLYLLSLLATCADSRPQAEQNWGDFNDNFVNAWKTSHNCRIWKSQEHAGIDQVHTRHICHGQLSINDMKIRWNSAMQSSERGKNLNNVLNRTSVAVSNTGKAVGEAWTSAKSVVSTWLFGFGGDDDDDLWSYEQE
ncbi:Late secretory pathway protein AVL9-like [Holothuria leucospilota]|uniref:Late secretory pathway protein AVL9-like n=1 Tax=Holothuria leucospilota TaxID=206669 RepID=A0A9Q1BG62_HOLLE|nr:Late secretory pathway protein AVL9-like [Holothuria leucospilota]